MIRCGTLAAFLLVFALLSASVVVAQEPVPEPVAPPSLVIVNGNAITRDDFLSTLKVYWGSEALRMLIDEQIVAKEAARLGVSATAADVDARLLREQEGYASARAFKAALRERGISQKALKRELKTAVLLDMIVDKRAGITDQKVSAYYTAHLTEFTTPARVDLYVITTGTIESAYLAAERIANEDFGVVAEDLSTDDFAATGGHWGDLTADEIAPEAVQVAAFNLEPGGRSEPIEVEGAFFVIWAKDKEPGSVIAEAGAAQQIKNKFRADKNVSRDGVLRSLRAAADVKIKMPGYAHIAAELKKAREIRVVVDGDLANLGAAPIQRNRMLVPAEAFAAALGASFEYFGVNDTMRIIKDDVTVIFGLNVSVANVNDEPIQLDQSPLRDGGVVYVPARWLADTLGGSVHWVPDTLTLNVKSVKVDAPISPGGGDGGPIPVPQPITDGDAP